MSGGERELPIQPDYTGRKVTVAADQRVEVYVPELDGKLGVDLRAVEPEAAHELGLAFPPSGRGDQAPVPDRLR